MVGFPAPETSSFSKDTHRDILTQQTFGSAHMALLPTEEHTASHLDIVTVSFSPVISHTGLPLHLRTLSQDFQPLGSAHPSLPPPVWEQLEGTCSSGKAMAADTCLQIRPLTQWKGVVAKLGTF